MILSGDVRVKLGDLGLACRLDESYGAALSEEGERRYRAGEIVLGEGRIDLAKADIFSFGASMYELALGRQLESSGEEWRNLR